MKIRLLSLLLAAVLLCTLLPLSVFAVEIVDSGECGDNVTFTLDSEGTLIISGSGEMTSHPWIEKRIKSVVIQDGVTSIDWAAFHSCTNLKDVTIAGSVTEFDTYDFYNCTALETIQVAGSNPNYRSVDGVLFNKAGTSLLLYPAGQKSTSYQIPEGVTRVETDAFRLCSALKKVTFPKTLEMIGQAAFEECTGLESLSLPENLKTIDVEAFSGCVLIPSLVIPKGVTTIGYDAFSGCQALASATVPDTVTDLGAAAFAGCTNLKSVSIPNSIKSIEVFLFRGCTNLLKVDIPDSVETIKSGAFENCTSLTTLTIPESVSSIESEAFSGCSNLQEITLPTQVESLQKNLFLRCTSLMDVKIPSGVTGIPIGMFFNCTSLRSVTIPNGVEYINEGAFDGCTNLADVYFVGTEYEWDNIRIMSRNEPVEAGAVHCLGHQHKYDYREIETPPTCTEQGYTTHVCTCGERYDDSYVPALGHVWDSGKVIKEPTKTENGVKGYTCTVCGDTKLESIPMTGPKPTATPAPTARPIATPAPTARPTATPAPTAKPTASPAPASNPFKDVAKDQYYAEPVLWAVNHDPQITAGTAKDAFSPNNPCTRGQIVTFLWRAKGCPEPTITKNPFTDVKASDYFYKAVLWAVEKEITAGTSKTTFSPNDTVTRAQTVTFLWRAEGKPAVKTANPFKDVPTGQYYTDAVLWAVKNEITAGTSATTFSPANPCTRAQIVTFLYRDLAK